MWCLGVLGSVDAIFIAKTLQNDELSLSDDMKKRLPEKNLAALDIQESGFYA